MFLPAVFLTFFAASNARVVHDPLVGPRAASITIASNSLSIPAASHVSNPHIHNPVSADLLEVFDNNEDGPPDQEDITWTHRFMTGESVDPSLEFHASDLVRSYMYPRNSEAAHMVPRATEATNDAKHHELISELAHLRLGLAFINAHSRSRIRKAGGNATSTPDARDFAWTQAFFSGQDINENMIFNPKDLHGPPDDDTAHLSMLAHIFGSSKDNTTTTSSEKRDNISEPDVLRIIRQAIRAVRRAHRRSRVRHQVHGKMKHHLTKWASDMQQHGTWIDGPSAHPNPPSIPDRSSTHSPKPSLTPTQSPTSPPKPAVTPGWNPDGSLDCEWWYCHHHVLNCGSGAPDPSWWCVG